MVRQRTVSTRPKIAIQYILDESKLKGTPGQNDFFKRVRAAIRGLGWEIAEFGPDVDAETISANAMSCAGQKFGAMLGVVFAGSSARQVALLGKFNGPVGVWFFPGTEWGGMASAGAGIGYLLDESRNNPSLKVTSIWGDPDDEETLERLQCFGHATHVAFAMKHEKIGLIGGSNYDGMPAGNWHPDVLTSKLGPSYMEIDITVLERALESVRPVEAGALVRRLSNAGMKLPDEDRSMDIIRESARVSLAVENLQNRFGLTGVAINCYGSTDPGVFGGVLGCCGANACLKAHALGTVVIGCEADVVLTAQQLIFKHLVGTVPCAAEPWKLDTVTGVLIAGTCSGPADLAEAPHKVRVEAGTLGSPYDTGVLGVCLPEIKEQDAVVTRIYGRELDRMLVATGRFLGSDSGTIVGRLSLKVELDNPDGFLDRGMVGNYYTILPTESLDRDVSRVEALCEVLGIEAERV